MKCLIHWNNIHENLFISRSKIKFLDNQEHKWKNYQELGNEEKNQSKTQYLSKTLKWCISIHMPWTKLHLYHIQHNKLMMCIQWTLHNILVIIFSTDLCTQKVFLPNIYVCNVIQLMHSHVYVVYLKKSCDKKTCL